MTATRPARPLHVILGDLVADYAGRLPPGYHFRSDYQHRVSLHADGSAESRPLVTFSALQAPVVCCYFDGEPGTRVGLKVEHPRVLICNSRSNGYREVISAGVVAKIDLSAAYAKSQLDALLESLGVHLLAPKDPTP